MATTGAINGTDCLLAIDVADNSTFVAVGGLTTNGLALNNTPIDITNKSSASWRELLGGEGLQAMDITGEMVFTGDTAFAAMKTAFQNKATKAYEIDRGGQTVTGSFFPVSWSETAADNDKVTVSVTLQSTGAITGL